MSARFKVGEWFRYREGSGDTGIARRLNNDADAAAMSEPPHHFVRVIVRDAKPRKTLTRSQADAWMREWNNAKGNFTLSVSPHGTQFYCIKREALSGRQLDYWARPTYVGAVAAARKYIGVKPVSTPVEWVGDSDMNTDACDARCAHCDEEPAGGDGFCSDECARGAADEVGVDQRVHEDLEVWT